MNMGSKKGKSYSREFKTQILKECMETNQYNVVARKHNVPVTTVYTWIKRDKTISKTQIAKGQKALEKERVLPAKARNPIFFINIVRHNLKAGPHDSTS